MESESRLVVGGALLTGAAGCFLAGVTVVLSRDAHWTDWGVRGLLFAGGLCLVLAIFVLAWPARQRRLSHARDSALSAYLGEELQTGYSLYNRARMAQPGTDELLTACQEFGDWAVAINEWVLANAAIHYSDLPQTAPWAMFGKASALNLMNERLRAHTALAKKLGGLEG
jgi:hypothetical protein